MEAWLDLERVVPNMASGRAAAAAGQEYFFDNEPGPSRWLTLEEQSATQYLANYHPEVTRLFDLFITVEGGGSAAYTSALLLVGWYAGNEDRGQTAETGRGPFLNCRAEPRRQGRGLRRLESPRCEDGRTTRRPSVERPRLR